MLGALLAVVTVFSFGDVDVRCENPGDWTIRTERAEIEKGVETLKITLDSPSAAIPPKFEVYWKIPQVDISNMWSVNEPYCSLPPNWGGWRYSALSYHMPLYVFFNGNDRSRFSVAASECAHHLAFRGGILEEGCFVESKFVYFDSAEAPMTHYETFLRFDSRDRDFGEAVRAGADAYVREAVLREVRHGRLRDRLLPPLPDIQVGRRGRSRQRSAACASDGDDGFCA